MKDLLLITPPFTQLNTPYPATAYLKGFLKTKSISAFQIDLGMEVILEVFSREGLVNIFAQAENEIDQKSTNCQRIFFLKEDYVDTIENVILFLQGRNATFARQVCSDSFLPEASRFQNIDDLDWAFGAMGMQDRAKHLCTLYLEDLSDFIVECIDPFFGFSRYAERLGRSANTFDELLAVLSGQPSFIDELTITVLSKHLDAVLPKMICMSVPFPGNLYSAFRCAQYIKSTHPDMKIVMGGGFPNTELRSVSDARVFDFFDYICLDDGELPIELLVSNVFNPATENPDFRKLKRTFERINGLVIYNNESSRSDYKQSQVGTPDYSDLLLDRYISVIEIANPMHSLWSDGRWNKLTMAHGCYWGKCTFCDISLDYIALYEPVAAKTLVNRVEEMIAQTGERGFHFVDEAAPPALMREFALEVLRRELTITWWTNIRFEKSFTRDLCLLLKASGCIAISGGLEVASDRLLALIDKGVTVEQVAQVTHHFTESGIMVHAYLMYGYPTQSVQETVDSLEMVRQMFEIGVLQSGFWHQFALTAHSPVGLDPDAFGVTPNRKEVSFAENDIEFEDKTGIRHEKFSHGLKKSLFNYMHGLCFDFHLQDWFDFKIPKTGIRKDFIERCLNRPSLPKETARVIWLGVAPSMKEVVSNKSGAIFTQLTFYQKRGDFMISLDEKQADWIIRFLEKASVHQSKKLLLTTAKVDYTEQFPDFDSFLCSKPMSQLRQHGLLLV